MKRWIYVGIVTLATPSPLVSQVQPERRVIVERGIAAVLTAYEDPMEGEVRVDVAGAGVDSLEELVVNGRRLLVSQRSGIYTCPAGSRGPMGCALVGADFMITVATLDIRGNEATVRIELEGNGESIVHPVWMRHYQILLRRSGDGWSVTEATLVFQT